MTNSFNIKPQRQVRKTTKEAARPAEGGSPTAPQYHQKTLGGRTLDFERYDPSTQLKTQQEMDSIRNLVEAGKQTIDKKVKETSKQKEAQGLRLFDKIRQYEIDTADLGKAIKDARKKGHDSLAQELEGSNPWLWFGLKTAEAKYAGQDAVVNTSNWVDANINDLRMREDPTEVRTLVQGQVDKFVQKNYPTLSDQMFTGLVEPVLAKGVPAILSGISEEHLKWRAEQRSLILQTNLNNSKKGWLSVVKQDPTNEVRNWYPTDQFRKEVMGYRDKYIANGGTFGTWQKEMGDWVKSLVIDTDGDGISDLNEPGMLDTLLEALDFELKGHPVKGTKFLDLTVDGVRFEDVLERAALDAELFEGKVEQARESKLNLESNRFKRRYKNGLHLSLRDDEGNLITGPQAQLIKKQQLDQLEAAVETGIGTIDLPVIDEDTGAFKYDDEGQLVTEAVQIPAYANFTELRKEILNQAPAIDDSTFRELEKKAVQMLVVNKNANLEGIYNQLSPGSKQWEAIRKLEFKAQSEAIKKDWEPTIAASFGSVKNRITELNTTAESQAITDGGPANSSYIKDLYKRLQKKNIAYANDLFTDYMRQEILEATWEEKNDDAWHEAKANEFINWLQNEDRFSNPQTNDLYSSDYDPNSSVPDLYLYNRGPAGDIDGGDTSKLVSTKDFRTLTEQLEGSSLLNEYHTKEPMIHASTYNNVVSYIDSGQELNEEALNNLRDGYQLANELYQKANGRDLNLMEFLVGQSGEDVFYNLQQSPEGKTTWHPYLKGDATDGMQLKQEALNRTNTLIRRLSNVAEGTGSLVKWTTGISGNNSENQGSINFWMEDRTTGSNSINFAAPVKMQVTGVGFNEGTDGHWSSARVLQSVGDLKEGYTITIRHARSFGALRVGQTLWPGNYWGLQHTRATFKVGVDQANSIGAGPHLNVIITDNNGQRLSQQKVSKIMKEVLSSRLAI